MIKSYLDYESRAWQPETPLYSGYAEQWFNNIDEVFEYLDDIPSPIGWTVFKKSAQSICEIARLFLGKPEYLPELEFPEMELPENIDNFDEILKPDHPISQKLLELNEFITKSKFVVCYTESNIRPDPETLGFK